MGTSEQYIRIGLRNNRFTFGSAVKLSTQWTYHISPSLFYEYIGIVKKNQSKESEKKNKTSLDEKGYYTLYM